jgi:hypothetical protein
MERKEFNLQNFIISVIIIGAVLIIGIYITSAIGQTTKIPNTAFSVINETGAYLNSSNNGGYYLSKYGLEGFTSPTILAVWNGSDLVSSGNYTISLAGLLLNTTTANLSYQKLNVSYNAYYTSPTNASEAAGNVTTALSNGTSWISILVVVGFAVIILSMLTSGLGKATAERAASTPYY